VAKRATDVVLATLGLLVLLPVLLLAACAILLDSGAPVFFRQTRVGRYGQTFPMYKFRSMVRDAQSVGPYFTSQQDARITKTGRFLRRSSIDELPQLLNVLKGDMSLVGPRPDLPLQQALYRQEDWQERCSVRPGITGLAQALLRSEATAEERLALDLRYVRKQSICMDVRILFWTARRISGKGAN
jgi:lipopolysaccharide/colanic/teichoic acid biosynthesis glycosyltransferase